MQTSEDKSRKSRARRIRANNCIAAEVSEEAERETCSRVWRMSRWYLGACTAGIELNHETSKAFIRFFSFQCSLFSRRPRQIPALRVGGLDAIT